MWGNYLEANATLVSTKVLIRNDAYNYYLFIYLNLQRDDRTYKFGHFVFLFTHQEFSLTMYLRQTWRDERLAYADEGFNRSISLGHRQFDRIWTPDVFIRNLKAGVFHEITVPNRLIRLEPDGTILYSQR